MNKITALNECFDKKDKVDIFVDGELVLTVSTDTVIESGIRVGADFDEDVLTRIEYAKQLVKAKHKAYDYLSYGDMSRKTLFDKLTRYGFDTEIASECVEYIADGGYIDDRRYGTALAERYANGRLYGRRRILSELTAKGIEKSLAEEIVSELDVDFEANARTLANGKFYRDTKDRKERAKLINALMRYGYDYDTIGQIITEDDYE